MDIDTNDIKIIVQSSLEFLMKFCWQCLKNHPIVSVLLLIFFSFYIFVPLLFNLLFYTTPLVICTAILLQGRFQFRPHSIRTDKSVDEATMKHQSSTPSRKLRPTIEAAMSRRTFKKRTCEELGTILMEDLKVDFIIRSFSDDIPMKLREELVSIGSDVCKKNGEAEKPSDSIKVDAESPKEEKEEIQPVLEEDQRNEMDLGSSEMERNKRLENLIAKRRARKMFSMQHYRNPLNSVTNDSQGHVSPIITERNNSDVVQGGQPGSAPSVLGPTNPFDLPYDPSEEKPILSGDGFAEEILITQPKDMMQYCRHESFTYGPSFFTKHFGDPCSKSIAPGLPKSRRHSDSDAGGSTKHVSEQSSQESENVNKIHGELSNEAKLKNMQSNQYEEVNKSAQNLSASHEEYADATLLELRDNTNEQRPDTEKQETQSNTSATEMSQDLIEDDNDETSSLSSYEATADVASASADVTVAVKNEAFRNSVKKVLAVIQENRAISSPRSARPTKMEERSFYTRPSHHLSYSIASDMQVEVSEGPNSPTDVESLVFHRDEDDTDDEDSLELEEESGNAESNNSEDFNVESSHTEVSQNN